MEPRLLLAADLVLLKDINPDPKSSSVGPRSITDAGDLMFFNGYSAQYGTELWRSDGTPGGTYVVRDIFPGLEGGNPQNLTWVNDKLFFVADDGVHGDELWVSDGTETGTVLVKDFRPGELDSRIEALVPFNGLVYFVATDGVHGLEVWKSDGTPAGTNMLLEIHPSTSDYSWGPEYLTVMNGSLYFQADDDVNGTELWKSDGTAAGTAMLRDIRAGSSDSSPSFLTNVNGTLYFSANDGSGFELWKSNGTTAGTVRVNDIQPGGGSSVPSNFVGVGDTVFFRANDGTNGTELWKSDGTSAGTSLVLDARPGSDSSSPAWLTNLNGMLVYTADDGTHGREPWISDGTAAGTTLLRDIRPGALSSSPNELVTLGSQVLFRADDGSGGQELWSTNGTESATLLRKDIRPGGDSSSPNSFSVIDGTLWFSANDGTTGQELWRSNGSSSGTALFADLNSATGGGALFPLANLNGALLFAADDSVNGSELWSTDGTVEGTVLVKDINPGTSSSGISHPIVVNGVLFFQANDNVHGRELWMSDGTTLGTKLVRDINPGSGQSRPEIFENVNGILMFRANDGTHGYELWRSDGTSAGTTLVRDILPGPESGFTGAAEAIGGTYFLPADDGVNGRELWASDGTAGGTAMVRDIYAGPANSSPSYLTNVNGTLYFHARDEAAGEELWKSNGSVAGTALVSDISPGPASSSPRQLTALNGEVVFIATTPETGMELWKSNGTAAGTLLLKDLTPGAEGAFAAFMTPVNNRLFFTGKSASSGYELWSTDGTTAGTLLVKDIHSGPGSSTPNSLTNINGTLYFSANDGVHGRELWLSDGTTAGTQAATSATGTRGTHFPYAILEFQDSAWVTANDPVFGFELFRVVTMADYGDAPEGSLHSDNGARHLPEGVRLGSQRDAESDATPDSNARGDDNTGSSDEDGVAFGTLVQGSDATITLDIRNAATQAFASVWIDLTRDGDWDDPGEQVLLSQPVFNGMQTFSIAVPPTATPGDAFARVRVSHEPNLLPTGLAQSGEVEDHLVTIREDIAVTLPSGQGANAFELRRDKQNLELVNLTTSAVLTWPLATTHSITINGAEGTDDRLTIDMVAGGSFSLAGGLAFHAGTEAKSDSLTVIAPLTAAGTWESLSSSGDTTVLAISEQVLTTPITFTGLESAVVENIGALEFKGDLPVGSRFVSAESATPVTSADSTSITGGTFTSSAELVLGGGKTIFGSGVFNASIAGDIGSLISATGSLTLGLFSDPAGFHTRGRIATGANTVFLRDANQSVLGSLTTLGSSGSPGTVTASNGLLIDFGNNVTGFGTLNTPNSPTRMLMVNGSIAGNSPSQQITLPGYIKGVGSLSNVNITGTYSPGFSPAVTYAGSITYGATSTSIMEIGGTTPGSSGHDQIVHSGTATLGGTLDIQLINGFVPAAGQSFVLMTADTVAGSFSTINTPDLPDGLDWEVVVSQTAVTASVVTAGAPSDPPQITGPSSPTASQRPVITWEPVSGAAEYEIWIKNQSTGVNPYLQATVAGTSWVSNVDLGIGQFNLWIRGTNSEGPGPWTSQYNFRINTRATVDDPGRYLDTHRPTLNWDPLPGAVTYDLWINDKLGGISPFIRDQNVTGTTWTPSSDMPLGLYHAWIRGLAADGTAGAWSVTTIFYVMQSPNVTAGMNSTFDRTPTIAWDPLLGAVKYEVFIRDRNTGLTTLYQQNIEALEFTPDNSLPDGPYRMWVLGVSAANARSFWTYPFDFFVGGRPDLTSPTGSTGDTTPTFAWTTVDGVQRYDLWVDQVGGTSQIIRQPNLTTTSYTPTTPLPTGTYRVWVRAISTTNETSPWSVTVEFTIAESSGPDWNGASNPEYQLTSVPSALRTAGEQRNRAESSPGPLRSEDPAAESPDSSRPMPDDAASATEGHPEKLVDAAMAWWAEREITPEEN